VVRLVVLRAGLGLCRPPQPEHVHAHRPRRRRRLPLQPGRHPGPLAVPRGLSYWGGARSRRTSTRRPW
jgi:hypothetical protein